MPKQRKVVELITAKKAPLIGNFSVRRALPRRTIRRIGGFVFFDHFGKAQINPKDFDVPPHPHIGLQTVTYLFSGEILHTDSLGSKQIIKPGDVNWMTAGQGITHAEQAIKSGEIHGIQSWVGLPHKYRKNEPDFSHFPQEILPKQESEDFSVRVIAGEYGEMVSPIPTFQELTYLDVQINKNAHQTLLLNPHHELGIYVVEGKISVEETEVGVGVLAKLSDGESKFAFSAKENSRFLIFGGEPLPEPTVIYWNFITDTLEEAKSRYEDWENGKFPTVDNYLKIT